MSKKPLTITIDPDSELGRALDENEPVVLVRGTTRFRVTRDPDDPWATYDPEAVREGLREIAGTLTPAEGERMKALIDRGREADDPWAHYDPAKLRASLKKVAGLLSPEEGDRIIESIYRGREEGTRPIDRP